MFNWIEFLISRGIPFTNENGVTSTGKRPGKDNLLIHCPFCGGAGAADYMHISLEGKGWYCWRRPQHAGRSPIRLVAALLGISLSEAASITGQRNYIPNDFLGTVMSKMESAIQKPSKRNLPMPKEFQPLRFKQSSNILATSYLQRRGFDEDKIMDALDIRFCRDGAYRNRIIFPVRLAGKLITWTGRTISKNVELRYKTLSADPDKAKAEGYKPALGKITDCLLWFDKLMTGTTQTIIITEGPFDALKIMSLGKKHGVVATCLFTNRPSKAQVELLYELLPRFRYRFLMLDQGTVDSMQRLCADFTALNLRHIILPAGIKDPGELDANTLASCILQKR